MFSDIIGHEEVIQKIEIRLKKNPNGTFLFYGPPSIGKRTIAFEASKAILCRDKKAFDCKCNSCKRFNTNHPDFLCVGRQERLKVDDINQILNFVETTSFISDHKVVIIDNVHDVTWEAANKLLKILEEPPKNFSFFLISPYPKAIIATIFSRCLKYEFFSLSREDLTNIIKEKLGFDLIQSQILGWLAIDSSMDIFSKAGHYLKYRDITFDFIFNVRNRTLIDSLDFFDKVDKEDLPIFADLLILLISDMILLKTGIEDIANMDLIESLKKLVVKMNVKALMLISGNFNSARGMKFNYSLGIKNALIKSYELFQL